MRPTPLTNFNMILLTIDAIKKIFKGGNTPLTTIQQWQWCGAMHCLINS